MKRSGMRLFSLLLCAVMLFGMLPVVQAAPAAKDTVMIPVDMGSMPMAVSEYCPTEAEAYAAMIALQETYPEGTPWTNESAVYEWNALVHDAQDGGYYRMRGYGCAAFSFILSDAAFGDLPAEVIYAGDFTFDDIRVGDILRTDYNAHQVIVMEKYDDYVVLAEGNYNSSVHWGRTMTRAEVESAATVFMYTRYPQESTTEPEDQPPVPDDATELEKLQAFLANPTGDVYEVNTLITIPEGEGVTLNIPDGVEVTVNAPLVVSTGAELIVAGNGILWVNSALDVYGLLTNKGNIMVDDSGYLTVGTSGEFLNKRYDENGFGGGEIAVYGTLDSFGTVMLEASLYLAGTMRVQEGSFRILEGDGWSGSLAVEEGAVLQVSSGVDTSSIAPGRIWQHEAANVQGVPKDRIIFSCSADSLKTLAEALEVSYAMTYYRVELTITKSMTLQGDLHIPDGTNLYIYGEGVTVTVPADASLTIEGTLDIMSCNLLVNGTLESNGGIWIGTGYGDTIGTLTLTEGAVYRGRSIYIYGGNNLWQDHLVLADDSGWQVTNVGYGSWEAQYVAGMKRLGAPTDLTWNMVYEWDWDPVRQESYQKLVRRYGSVSWKPGSPDQAEADVVFYREGDTESWTESWWSFGSEEDVQWYSVDDFILSDPESGTYYFTVQSKADGTQYMDSEIVTSDTWTYTKPTAKLESCTDLTWVEPEGGWIAFATSFQGPKDQTYAGGYEMEFWYAPTAEEAPEYIGATWGFGGVEDTQWSIWDELLQEYGIGYYYYRVRALSSDITQVCNGEWSELSPAYNMTELSVNINTSLEDILFSGFSTEEKIAAVQELDSAKLKTAMLTDSNVVELLAMLEAEAGGAAAIDVRDKASAFDAGDISVVGANLNKTADGAEGITLVVDKPEKEHIIDEAYNNSVAVRFSMTLDNAQNAGNLEVPVQITLPVPETINPAFLVVLHYHQDGSVEELLPHIYYAEDRYYAEFVISSFSDFIMTELAAECTHLNSMTFLAITATCNSPGRGEFTICNDCGEILYGSDAWLPEDPNNHTQIVAHPAVTGTCLEPGHGAYTVCEDCGTVIDGSDAAIPGAHVEVVDDAVAATCTETGLTEGKHCSVCEEVLVKQEVVDALGHVYEDGVCTLCGTEKPAFVTGDVDGNGEINNFDLLLLLYHTNKRTVLEDTRLLAADIDGDGKVNVWDVSRMVLFLNKRIPSL